MNEDNDSLINHMNDNQAKTICTTVIWTATAIIFTFGLFRFNWTGAFSGILWAFVGAVLAMAATKATRAVWKSSPPPTCTTPPPAEQAKP